MEGCIELAASLNAAYQSPISNNDPFSAGIFASMCIPSCVVRPDQDHFAASWFHTTIGPALLPGAFYGVVLDDTAFDVLCISPIDLASDLRDDMGCGPFKMDPRRGSIGRMNAIRKYFFRRGTIDYKNLNFGREVSDWAEIPCTNFFNDPALDLLDAVQTITDPSTATPFTKVLQDQYQAILGHPVCNVSRTRPTKRAALLPLFAGDRAWSLEEWPLVLSLQQKLLDTYPSLWNEIVLRLPDQLNNIVKGVFYLENPYTDGFLKATQLARLYHRPLLEMLQYPKGNVTFVCRDKVGTESVTGTG